nr:7133_t:CDS:2 [Entrophospora candida]
MSGTSCGSGELGKGLPPSCVSNAILYTSTLMLFDAKIVPSYLNEDGGWNLKVEGLNKPHLEAKRKLNICYNNPGNTTGQ